MGDQPLRRNLFSVEADACRAGQRRDVLQGAERFPLRNQPIGNLVTFHRDTPFRSQSLFFFRLEGVDSVTVLRATSNNGMVAFFTGDLISCLKAFLDFIFT